jgi:hypothetical protein
MLKPTEVTFAFPDGNDLTMDFDLLLRAFATIAKGCIAIDTNTGQPVQMDGMIMADAVFSEILSRALQASDQIEKTPEEIESESD